MNFIRMMVGNWAEKFVTKYAFIMHILLNIYHFWKIVTDVLKSRKTKRCTSCMLVSRSLSLGKDYVNTWSRFGTNTP